MSLLKLAGIRPAQPEDDARADRAIRVALASVAVAHARLREHIRHDPRFASSICRALGCTEPGCDPAPTMRGRIEQIPPIIDRLSKGTVLPKSTEIEDGGTDQEDDGPCQ